MNKRKCDDDVMSRELVVSSTRVDYEILFLLCFTAIRHKLFFSVASKIFCCSTANRHAYCSLRNCA